MNLAGKRILVCGGRDFTDYPLLCGTLAGGAGATAERQVIIHGEAPGADRR